MRQSIPKQTTKRTFPATAVQRKEMPNGLKNKSVTATQLRTTQSLLQTPLPLQRKVNINDDSSLEKEADVMGEKASSVQLQAASERSFPRPAPRQPVAQRVLKPFYATANTHLRKVEGGQLYSGFLGTKSIGDKIKVDDEVEADVKVDYGKGFIKGKFKGTEGAIRANKITAKKGMTSGEIADLSEDAPPSSTFGIMKEVVDVGKKATSKEATGFKLLGYGKKTKEKEGKKKILKDYENDTANEVSKYTEATASGVAAMADMFSMLEKADELRGLMKSKSWNWDKAAKLGLSVAISTSSMAGNVASTYGMVERIREGSSKDDKTGADDLSSLFGKITAPLKVLKGLVSFIADGLKAIKKGGKKNYTKFVKSIAGLGGNIMKVLAKFKVLDKTGRLFTGSVPFLKSIVDGAEAVLGFIKMAESSLQATAVAPKSAMLRHEIGAMLGDRNGDTLVGEKGDQTKIFHYEKRGMMFYRKTYARLNPTTLGGVTTISSQAKFLAKATRSKIDEMFQSVFSQAPIAARTELLKVGDLIGKEDGLEMLELSIFNLINQGYFKQPEAETAAIDIATFVLRKRSSMQSLLSKTTQANILHPLAQKQLLRLAADESKHQQLAILQKKLLEYELADKIVEINHKREAVGKDAGITSIINVISDIVSSIGGFVSAGASILAGKIVSGATSAYQGSRAGAKFFQSQFRKKGKFGTDQSRSKTAKHAEYVRHAKVLTQMWIAAADTANLDAAKGAMKKDDPTQALEQVKTYLLAAGLKVKDLLKLPAMKIPDVIVDALKDR